MKYRHFGSYLRSLQTFEERPALTIRPFLKIERLSYGQLLSRSHQAAHFLRAQNLEAGDRVMLIATNSPDWVCLFFGAQLLGIVVVPVDARSNASTVTTFIGQTQPKLIIRSQALLEDLTDHQPIMTIEECAQAISQQPDTAPQHSLTGDETAVIVFTSGTTAAPKGVVLSQRNILANVEDVCAMLTIKSRWRFLSVLPLSHMYELTCGCLAVLSGGAQIVYLPSVTPLAISQAFSDHHITSILAVPQLLSLLLDRILQTAKAQGQLRALQKMLHFARYTPWPLRRHLFAPIHRKLGSKLQFVVTGGAPIPVEVAQSWEAMGVKMVQGYGLTETSPVLTMNTLTRRRLDSQGRIVPGAQLRVGADNEIQARGHGVFSGYWHNTAATQAAFTDDGWLRTGDVGRLDDGWLTIQGRAKFAIVLSSGLKVFPEDVELVADKHPLFKELCVVGVTQPDGEVVTAVTLSDAPDSKIDAAIAAINMQLESFQHISQWRRWPEAAFPRTRLLKIDRRAVQRWANDTSKQRANTSPQTAPSDNLKSILRQVLNDPTKQMKDSDILAELGFDSLRRLSVVSLIEERLNIDVPESKIDQKTTVKQLRRLIDKAPPIEPPTARPTWTFWWITQHTGNFWRDCILRPLARIWIKRTVVGKQHLKNLSQPALFIFNHVDGLDGPNLYHSLPKTIRNHLAVAVAEEVMTDWKHLPFFFRWGFRAFNFSRQQPYLPSLQYLATLVDRGWNIALAPEGKISQDGRLLPFKSGIGLLAVELGIPVVPIKTIGLHGTVPDSKFWPQQHSVVTVKIGQPVTFPKGTDYHAAAQELHDIVKRL